MSRGLWAILPVLFLTVATGSPAGVWIPLTSDDPSEAQVVLEERAPGVLRVVVSIPGVWVEQRETPRGTFDLLWLPGAGVQGEVGHPQLPALRLLVAVPYGGECTLEMESESWRETPFPAVGMVGRVLPAQPPVEKIPGARERAPFVVEESVYARPGYLMPAAACMGQEGFLRGQRFVEVIVSPVDVDHVGGKARLLTAAALWLRVQDPDLSTTRERAARYHCREFEVLQRRVLLSPSQGRDLAGLPNPPKLLVITEPGWASNSALQAYLQWKRSKGFGTVLVTTNQTGTTTTSIKNYIQNAYDTWPEPPTAVLLVGDTGGIPNWVGIGANNPATDLNYTLLEGSDYFPDIEIGRWSVTTSTHLNNIASKSLSYEQVGWTGNDTWEKYAVFMASEDNYTVSEGTHNFVISNYLQPDGYSYDRLYCHTYNATTQQVRDAHNAGRSLSIYSGHGAETYWADGPPFYQSDVNNLVNTVYPFVQSYACYTGKYTVSECFAETWIRAPRAAIGMMASSVTSYWTEDDILEKRVMEGFCANVNAGEENQTWPGGMMNYGKLRYYQYFGNTSTTRRYFEMYNIMGDPTIDLWTAVPQQLTVNHAAALPVGASSFQVTVSGFPDWALVCVADEAGQVYARSYLLSPGTATLSLGSGPTAPGTLFITVTGHDARPYQASIPIVAAQGPCLALSGATAAEGPGGNGNGQPDFGETVVFTLTIQNVGSQQASGVNVVMSESSPHFAFTDSTQYVGTIPAGGQVVVQQGFWGTLSPTVPDGHQITCAVAMTDQVPTTWTGSFSFTAHAPVLGIGQVTVLDPTGNNNGRLDPGETATLLVTVANTGTAPVSNLWARLSTQDPYLSVVDSTHTFSVLQANSSGIAEFAVVASASTPPGHPASLHVAFTGTNFASGADFGLTVGLTVEDFETGTFASFPWQMGGSAPWTIVSTNPYEGSYCARSGTITHSQSSSLQLSATVVSSGQLSFWYRVSSEANYDYLKFLLDGQVLGQWSGEVGWTQATYTVGPGPHTFTWQYSKDGSVNAGSDCAWLDYIVFPPLAPIPVPDIHLSAPLVEGAAPPGGSAWQQVGLQNQGTGDLTFAVSVVTTAAKVFPGPVKVGKDVPDVEGGSPPEKASGGPDGFGYRWADSNEPGGPSYSWVVHQGTQLPGADDASYGPFDLGFVFPFYGTPYTQVRVCTNGYLSLTSSTAAYLNAPIPSTSEPNAVIAPFWDDLDTRSSGQIVYTSDVPNGRFIVSWIGVPHYSSSGTGTYTFQAILYSNGVIVFQYQSLEGLLSSCTVGIENATGTDGLQVVYNAPYLSGGMAVRFTPGVQWLSASPLSGTVPPGGCVPLQVTMNAAGLSQGDYTGTIVISSNDPDEGNLQLPVTFHVGTISPPQLVAGVGPSGVRLSWSAVPQASGYWVYGASNQPYFVPGLAPGYAYRLVVLPQGTTQWDSGLGLQNPEANWVFLVVAVNGVGQELVRSNRAGEHEFSLP